ncbi:Chemotaxis response regulator protein-glutamate methylesterase [Candidatus Arcanobacter lacustris]|jgi:two-component system chemotaxis response regulator CheB|uniref:Protein-glutamate methylesterase/protein-glutamine glutaminase n=1 Tax=Candidatus Arcanibacter lacustris TaxID=1607817 RepID=A0A0F5MN25_9RICK|nr:Chemotaxis response regulator protein-glutamate methylesterase [Candidatus Arcanobacter lacustris]
MSEVKENFTNDPIRVMIVDDSAVIRNLLTRALSSDPEITIITTAANGSLALNYVKKYDIEVLILDIEMPEMDGLTALPKILETSPNIKIVMVSSLTVKNAPVAIKALSLGASDYIEKPSAITSGNNVEFFNLELINKVKSLGHSSRVAAKAREISSSSLNDNNLEINLRNNKMESAPEAIAISCSTGGPQALQVFFSNLKKSKDIIKVPIFITQHMPALFTSYLADHIKEASGLASKEASDGEIVNPSVIYVAPGDYHMIINKADRGNIIRLTKDNPENYCRPSADPMLRSLAKIYKSRLLSVVLSGMGVDGLQGCHAVVDAGGYVAVQDKVTSVVWGMPGAVAKAGLASAMLPIANVADFVVQLMVNRN